MPLLLYVYLWIPESTSFTILTYHFEITAYQSYYVLGKLYVLFFLGFWFISESRFWRYCFIPGILLTIYQTVSIIGGVHLGIMILSLLTLLFGSLYLLVFYSLSKLFFSHVQNSAGIVTSDILVLVRAIQEHRNILAVKESTIDTFKTQAYTLKRKSILDDLKDLEAKRQFGSEFNFVSKTEATLPKATKIVVVITLLLLPILYYSYTLVPTYLVEFQFLGFSYSSGFPTLQTFVYFVCIKMFSLIYLLIWFLTCKQIWRYGVLMNLIIVAFQLFSIFNPSISRSFDEHELYYSFPFLVPLVLLLFFLFIVVNYQTKIKKADEQLELEIVKIIEKHQSSILNEPFAIRLKQLLDEKQYLDKKTYEEKLLALRENLSFELKVLQNKSL